MGIEPSTVGLYTFLREQMSLRKCIWANDTAQMLNGQMTPTRNLCNPDQIVEIKKKILGFFYFLKIAFSQIFALKFNLNHPDN